MGQRSGTRLLISKYTKRALSTQYNDKFSVIDVQIKTLNDQLAVAKRYQRVNTQENKDAMIKNNVNVDTDI
jgi:hypothetical protein